MTNAKQQQALEKIPDYCLMDNIFFHKCLDQNKDGIECLLHVITRKKDLKVVEFLNEKDVFTLVGRGVRFDVFAIDSKGKRSTAELWTLNAWKSKKATMEPFHCEHGTTPACWTICPWTRGLTGKTFQKLASS